MSVNCSQVGSHSVDTEEMREELGLPSNPDAICNEVPDTSPITPSPPSKNGPLEIILLDSPDIFSHVNYVTNHYSVTIAEFIVYI